MFGSQIMEICLELQSINIRMPFMISREYELRPSPSSSFSSSSSSSWSSSVSFGLCSSSSSCFLFCSSFFFFLFSFLFSLFAARACFLLSSLDYKNWQCIVYIDKELFLNVFNVMQTQIGEECGIIPIYFPSFNKSYNSYLC